MRLKSLSLRFKFMAAMTVIPIVGLSAFLLLAKNIFERDKIAYVFDSSLVVSKTRAARVSSEVSSVISIAQAIVLSYRADTKNLAEAGTYYFDRETKFEAFQLYGWNAEASTYERNVDLGKPNGKRLLVGLDKTLIELVHASRQRPILVRGVESRADRVLLVARFGEVNDPRHIVALALFEASELAQIFSERGPSVSFLSRREDGRSVFKIDADSSEWSPESVWKTLSDKNIPEGIEELASGKTRYLASFSEVGVADLVVVSMVDRKVALAAVDVLLHKSVFFFFAVIAGTMIIAIVVSRSMTFALSRLSAATGRVAQGDFSVRVEMRSDGEIGLLESSFNAMAGEISRLVKETAEKARMESELATARAVQETLFPESHARLGSLEIVGHYMPAIECGGDWWFYNESTDGKKVYIWIGDATGHGAPAALLTSAARAVASVIASGPAVSVSEALGILNRAICETSKGKMMMTFFLACIDKETGEMSYANASHDPPMLLHKSSSEPTMQDFIPLNEVNNPRLGEQNGKEFKETYLVLKPGDSLVFYTDGVLAVKNGERKEWGERRFVKALGEGITNYGSSLQALDSIVQHLETYRGNMALDDDVTLILCQYKHHQAATAVDDTDAQQSNEGAA